jgi:fatty acid desaturase
MARMETTPAPDPRLKPEVPLTDFTASTRRPSAITWYRTKIASSDFKRLHERDNVCASFQTFGHLGLMLGLGALAILSWGRWPWWAGLGLVCAYGMVASFCSNAVHELGHGTVFSNQCLNRFFCHIFAFLGWINHELFQSSHVRHHRYTLHPPDDLEVRLPIHLAIRDFLKIAVINYGGIRWIFPANYRIARGRFEGEWELTLYPPEQPELRRVPMRWACVLLIGHGAIGVLSLLLANPMIWIVITFGSFFCNGLFWLCNSTQHVGLVEHSADFRLNSRTFTLNPALRFLYWQMNYHIEHHMYAAVPCYRLPELHRLVKHDLPPCAHGLFSVWREIGRIMLRQQQDPAYVAKPVLPFS